MASDPSNGGLSEQSISEALRELALDLRSSFHHSADRLFEWLDPELWESTHNPWIVLRTVSRERLQNVTHDPEFQALLTEVHRSRRDLERMNGFKKHMQIRESR